VHEHNSFAAFEQVADSEHLRTSWWSMERRFLARRVGRRVENAHLGRTGGAQGIPGEPVATPAPRHLRHHVHLRNDGPSSATYGVRFAQGRRRSKFDQAMTSTTVVHPSVPHGNAQFMQVPPSLLVGAASAPPARIQRFRRFDPRGVRGTINQHPGVMVNFIFSQHAR